MAIKTFNRVSAISMALTIIAATLSIIGVLITGFYPGIIVLFFVALIPLTSRYYANKMLNKSQTFKRNYYTVFTLINLFLIFVVLWMTFVIVHDRVLKDCC